MSTSQQQTRSGATTAPAKQAITADLVQQIADKVYRLWLQEVQIEQERQRETVNGKR